MGSKQRLEVNEDSSTEQKLNMAGLQLTYNVGWALKTNN